MEVTIKNIIFSRRKSIENNIIDMQKIAKNWSLAFSKTKAIDLKAFTKQFNFIRKQLKYVIMLK